MFRRPLDRRRQSPPLALGNRRDLERHVARCRRGGTSAELVVARSRDGTGFPADLESYLRLSDSWLRERPDELVLLCDGDAVDRAVVERRLHDLTGGSVRCGWAVFPRDGLVLEDLIAFARRAAVEQPADRAVASRLWPDKLLLRRPEAEG